MYMLYIWLAIIAVGLLLEAVEAGTLVTIWFSAGAIIPLIMSAFGITEPWYIILQIVVFGIVTILCLVFIRKIAKRTLFKNSKEKTNMDLNVGKIVKVSRIDGEFCYIKLNGIEYNVVDDDGEVLNFGDQVEILKIRGNKIVVNKINKEEK